MDDSAAMTAGPADSVTVFLLDDHEIVRRGVRELLEAEHDIKVVGEASTAAQALARIPAARPKVAVLDARLPDGSGIDVCREIRSSHPEINCLILTSFNDDEAVLAALMGGACGYLLKEIRGINLVQAVRQVAAGMSLLDPAVTEQVLHRLRQGAPQDARLAGLNQREREILDLIAQGMTNRQIGRHLSLAEKTVKNYVSFLLRKLGMETRTQAAVFRAELRGGDHVG